MGVPEEKRKEQREYLKHGQKSPRFDERYEHKSKNLKEHQLGDLRTHSETKPKYQKPETVR